jgi:hypothetical protein
MTESMNSIHCLVKVAGAVLAIAILPSTAIAGCAPGETPSYADIDGVAVRRYALVGTWPRFDAHFNLVYYKDAQVVVGTLDAQWGLPVRGTLSESSGQTFDALRAVLQDHDFYRLRLTPERTIYLDGPEDVVSVSRCGVTTTLGFFVQREFVNQDNGQIKALVALLDDLQRVIGQLPWTPSPSPSPNP